LGNLFTGTPASRENVSTLLPGQQQGFNQLQGAAQGRGAGGAFGESADYYRNLLGDNSEDYNAFARPELRRFHEQTIPGLSEQFAGMGSGGLESSGFRNAAVGAGTDLSERLGAIRAQLRQQGAQGLAGIGQQALGNYSQNMETQPGTEGLLAPALGAVGTAIGSPALGALGAFGGNWLKGKLNAPSQDMTGANSSWKGLGAQSANIAGRRT